MEKAASSPGSGFNSAHASDWHKARKCAEQLLVSTRDLRVAVVWARTALYVEGFEALAPGLRLVHGMLDRFWDCLHPRPDSTRPADYYARVHTLNVLAHYQGLLGLLRQTKLLADLPVRTVEVALGELKPSPGEQPPTLQEIKQRLHASATQAAALKKQTDDAFEQLQAIGAVLQGKLDNTDATLKLSALEKMLGQLAALFAVDALTHEPSTPELQEDTAREPTPASQALPAAVRSRSDAVAAIDLVCSYLDAAEPTNPAPLLLRRARRLIDQKQSFLQVMQEFAPNAVPEVAKLMGVDPATLKG